MIIVILKTLTLIQRIRALIDLSLLNLLLLPLEYRLYISLLLL
jgi:hypothetical protein